MQYKIQNLKPLSSEELLSALKKSAAMYSEYADTMLLFIFREKRTAAYDFYEVRYGKSNFMHLAGIKSKNLNAIEFYEHCLHGTIKKEDCNPRRDSNTMYSKVAILEQLLDLRNSKCYKIGKKNLVTRLNDFEMATGNDRGIVGYDSRIRETGTSWVNKKKVPMPTTLLNNAITDYCTRPKKIMFILQKKDSFNTYGNLFYEIKKGLFAMERINFSDELKELMGDF